MSGAASPSPPRAAFITGILGQDGSLLAELLLSKGYVVAGTVRPGAPPPNDPRRRAIADRCRMVELDLDEAAQVRACLAQLQPDELYHLAAVHHSSERPPGLDIPLQQAMLRVNFQATLTLANGIVQTRPACRLLLGASSQMYRPATPPLRVDEATPRQPATFYGCTKSWSMDVVQFFREKYGLWGCTAILFNHESMRRSPAFVSRKITQAAARARLGLPTELRIENPAAQTDWSSAADVVAAMHAIAAAPEAADYVVGSGVLHSVQDWLDLAFGRVGLDWRAHVQCGPAAERGALVADVRRLRQQLGWSAATDFAALVEQMTDHDLGQLQQAHTGRTG